MKQIEGLLDRLMVAFFEDLLTSQAKFTVLLIRDNYWSGRIGR